MTTPGPAVEDQIAQWRGYVRRRRAIDGRDVDELEGHLRDEMEVLTSAGLAGDEAFLVAVKRMGDLDALSREFAREHSERLWKQLVIAEGDSRRSTSGHAETVVVFGLACAAAAAVKAPGLLGIPIDTDAQWGGSFYARNAVLLVLPFLAAYFLWKRGAPARVRAWLIVAFVAAAACTNAYPFPHMESDTAVLMVLHVPIALWLAVGIAYVGGRWVGGSGRMDFVRFSGELFIYYVLIALGGGVLTGFTVMMFQAIGLDASWLAFGWLVPCGAAGAVLVASWLVEAKQSVIENMAPVLTRLFTPLFTVILLAFLGTMAWTGNAIDIKREILIAFDLLLALVVGLVLYATSARDPKAPPDLFDWLQLLLIVSALAVDVVALTAIAGRISEYGMTPNRVAALGENFILLVNLLGSAWLYLHFVRGTKPFAPLERWQTDYLPIYSAWAAVVVIVFPPLFMFA